MNFFGHVWIASRRSSGGDDDKDGHAFGAMLPDFCSMAGTRGYDVLDTNVERGVALHHETDAVFHRASTFVELCRIAAVELRDAGVDRGSARAVAHVGTELLLDGHLVSDLTAGDLYLSALDEARSALASFVRFGSPAASDRVHRLLERLHDYGVPVGYRDPEFVTARLVQTLAPRPRLALSQADAATVQIWAQRARPTIVAAADELITEVIAALQDGSG